MKQVIFKRLIFIVTMIMAMATASATEYTHLLITCADGSDLVLKSAGLRVTYVDGNLCFAHADGVVTFEASTLATMQFTDGEAGIADIVADGVDTPITLHALNGIHIGCFATLGEAISAAPASGIYIITTTKGSMKIHIDK